MKTASTAIALVIAMGFGGTAIAQGAGSTTGDAGGTTTQSGSDTQGRTGTDTRTQNQTQGGVGSDTGRTGADAGSQRDQAETGSQTQGSDSQARSQTQGGSGSQDLRSLAMQNPDMLQGKMVRSAAGNDIGEVESLVRSRADQQIYAVVSAGGFLGIGEDQVVVPIDDLDMQGQDTIVMSQNAEATLGEMTYDEENYTKLEGGSDGMGESGSSGAGAGGAGGSDTGSTAR